MMRYKSRDREPLPTHLQLGVLVVSSRQSVGQHADASQQEEEDTQSLHRGRCSSQMNDPANGASAFMCSAAAPSPFATSLSPAQSHVAWSGQVRTRGCGQDWGMQERGRGEARTHTYISFQWYATFNRSKVMEMRVINMESRNIEVRALSTVKATRQPLNSCPDIIP